MFRLVKILNGRINQGEPVRLPSKANEVNTMLKQDGYIKSDFDKGEKES